MTLMHLLTKISHLISFKYCLETVIIRVWGMKKSLLWYPFDDSRGLHDPKATERGLQRPRDVASLPLLTKKTHLTLSSILLH